jgi:hypothetical protein
VVSRLAPDVPLKEIEDHMLASRRPGLGDCRECGDPAVVGRKPMQQVDIEHYLADQPVEVYSGNAGRRHPLVQAERGAEIRAIPEPACEQVAGKQKIRLQVGLVVEQAALASRQEPVCQSFDIDN